LSGGTCADTLANGPFDLCSDSGVGAYPCACNGGDCRGGCCYLADGSIAEASDDACRWADE